MRRTMILPLAIALLIASAKAEAYSAGGVGNASCETWTAARSNQQGATYEQWVLGFLSGVGFIGSNSDDPLKAMNVQAVLDWIDRYCKAHSADVVAKAGAAYVYLHPRFAD